MTTEAIEPVEITVIRETTQVIEPVEITVVRGTGGFDRLNHLGDVEGAAA
ncbi:MAG TPA: hypothetical protein VNQ73_21670 [Ilumatobacter sp.]|nr:hypothetical protein [Ilumatobacter sp.]